ncbi:MAG: hypothetical protein WA731_10700 [Pseudonocardiaceae bacterium]
MALLPGSSAAVWLLRVPAGAGGMGCGAWRSATIDWVVIGAGKIIGVGLTPAAGPGAAAGPGTAALSWLRTGGGSVASGATSPSLTIAVIPSTAPLASTKQAAMAALAARLLGGSGAAISRRRLATTLRR